MTPTACAVRARYAPARRTFFALVAAALLPASAFADTRADAKRHFREGMSLIAAGQMERGIAELKQAYAIKPHADVLYDIAKAYVELGNIPEALNHFRQYVATEPEDKEQVLKVIARLQAAIGPQGAALAQQQAAGIAGPIDAAKLLAQIQALVAAQQPAAGGRPAKGAVPAAAKAAPPKDEEMFEPEVVTAKTRATAREIAQELADSSRESAGEDLFEEHVVTASVRSTSELKAPASLTVITEEQIRLTGAATVPEILRRVPGVDVAEMNPSDTNVSIRGFNRRLANKVLVLIDGRSAYQEFLGNTLWPLLDVSVQDIERIEVVRGPGSARYGANAFAGVINIITKSGADNAGGRVWTQAGSANTVQGGVSAGGRSGRLTYRTTLAYERADQADAFVPAGTSPQFGQVGRSREVQRANTTAEYRSGALSVRAAAGLDHVDAMEVVSLGSLRTFGNSGQAGFAHLDAGYESTHVKVFWNAFRLRSGPEFWPSSLSRIDSSIRSDVLDAQVETGVDYKLFGKHHLDFGGGYRLKAIEWPYLAPKADGSSRYSEEHFDVFFQDEWTLSRALTLSLSYRVDRHPLLARRDVTPGGLVHSPRGTLLYELNRNHVVRFSAGSAFRAPTFLESYASLFAPVAPGSGIRFLGDESLKPEQVLQAEIGYRGRTGSRFEQEAVIYVERVTSLIADGPVPPPAGAGSTDPVTGQTVLGYTGFQNDPGRFLGIGAEIGFKAEPADGVELAVNYSIEKIADCTQDCTFSPSQPAQAAATANTAQHKLNFVGTWRTRIGVDVGLDVHHVSGLTWYERSFNASAPGGIVVAPYDVGAYTLVNGRIAYHVIKDRLQAGVAFYNLLDDGHREHPFGATIARRFLFTGAASF